MDKILTIGTDYVFPIGGGEVKNDRFHLQSILGTAFSISDGIFMTAGHVLKELIEHKYPNYFIGSYNAPDSWRAWEFSKLDINIHPDCDVGIFKVEIPLAKTAGWCSEEPHLNGDVYADGFPFALDPTNVYVYFRHFKGYIVAKRPFFRIKPMHPRCYELSFMCPRGLSGAPIYTSNPNHKDKHNSICGMVIGNDINEIEIYRHEEIVEEVDISRKTIYQKTETTVFGIGLTSSAIFSLHFDMLGCTVREHLERYNAVI